MASASVLGSMTGHGYSVGDAVGVGSMMEANSEAVAKNLTPLIMSVRDPLKASEQLELLSLEWDLDRTPSPEILPEQLIVAGGAAGEVSSQVCMLTWEKGVVDPFNIEEHVNQIAKKLADIEAAASASGLRFEKEGVAVLRRFSNRLNRVLFVDMLDRQFQGSWSTLRVKPQDVDAEVVVRQGFHKDFSTLPPGIRILKRVGLDFLLPDGDDSELTEHFKHRVLSPSAVKTLSIVVPEIGRAILNEMNTYAYSIEEVDVAKAMSNALTVFMGRGEVQVGELDGVVKQVIEFMGIMRNAVRILSEAVEQHVSSGASLSLAGHKEKLDNIIASSSTQRERHIRDVTLGFLNDMTSRIVMSAGRELPSESDVKAWQLKSAAGYFLTYAKKVIEYFAEQLHRFLVVSFARVKIVNTLQDFRQEMLGREMSPAEVMLFNKLYDKLFSMLSAALDRRACEGLKERSPVELIDAIIREITDAFANIDVWDLIEFGDIAQIARSEIETKYNGQGQDRGQLPDQTGEALMDRLSALEALVTQTFPDIAETLLSRRFVTQMIDSAAAEHSDLMDSTIRLVDVQRDKSEQWKIEARRLTSDAFQGTSKEEGFAQRLLAFTRTLHETIGSAVTSQSILERVSAEAQKSQAEYDLMIGDWEANCSRIEAENARIREQNEMRDRSLKQASVDYGREMTQYEEAKKAYSQPAVSGPPSRPPETLQQRIRKIEQMYPVQMTKPMPARPDQPQKLLVDIQLRDLLAESLEETGKREELLESMFAERLKGLRTQEVSPMIEPTVSISDGFLEYLMGSTIRSISRLLPRASRVYLKSPDEPDLIYLVTYEYRGDELTVRIGSNFLR